MVAKFTKLEKCTKSLDLRLQQITHIIVVNKVARHVTFESDNARASTHVSMIGDNLSYSITKMVFCIG
jgi:hypothetical protein